MSGSRQRLYCSFCGKREDEVGYLVAGPQVFICNECVELCREIGQNMLSINVEPDPRKTIPFDDLRKQVEDRRKQVS